MILVGNDATFSPTRFPVVSFYRICMAQNYWFMLFVTCMPKLFVTVTKDVYISCVCVRTPVLYGAFKVAITVPKRGPCRCRIRMESVIFLVVSVIQAHASKASADDDRLVGLLGE